MSRSPRHHLHHRARGACDRGTGDPGDPTALAVVVVVLVVLVVLVVAVLLTALLVAALGLVAVRPTAVGLVAFGLVALFRGLLVGIGLRILTALCGLVGAARGARSARGAATLTAWALLLGLLAGLARCLRSGRRVSGGFCWGGVGGLGGRAVGFAATLTDGGDQVALAHSGGALDADLLGQCPQFGQHHRR